MPEQRKLLSLALLIGALFAAPAAAQDYDGSIGYGGGGIFFTDFNSGGSGAQLRLDPGWVATAHIDHWVDRGRFGGRINAAFTQRPLTTLTNERSIRTWIVGGDLLLRLLPAGSPRGAAPYIGLGVGRVSYGLGKGGLVILEGQDASYSGDNDKHWAVSGAFGIDILPTFTIFGTPSGVRLEVMDHMTLESPFEPLAGSDFDPVHNVRVAIELLGLVQLTR
jgi:hypothetical protein